MDVLQSAAHQHPTWLTASSTFGSVADRSGAEHSIMRRWQILCMLFLRHRQFAWWFLWQSCGPFQHMLRLFTQWLDTVVYPQLRTMQVDRPVFVFGHPRSGTTFLQRRLFETGQASMFKTWELWFPTLTYRRFARSIVSLLRQIGLGNLSDQESGHEIKLDGIEEDESLFMHRLDSEMLNFVCPFLVTDPDVAGFWSRLGRFNALETRRSIRYYNEVLKRQIVYTGKPRVVAKSNPNIFRIRALLKEFSDGKYIYLVRSPESAIRSYLTLHDLYVSKLVSQEQRSIYMRTRYQWCVDLYLEFERMKSRIPPQQLLVLQFEDLVGNLIGTMRSVIEFSELEPCEEFWEKQRQRVQASHPKSHENAPLEYFGLSRDEVRRDLQSVYDEYGLK